MTLPKNGSSPLRALLFVLLTVTGLALAGCAGQIEPERTGTVYPDTLALMERKGMARTAPILVRIYKEDRALEVWKQDGSGRYALLKSYPICRFSGGLGPKKAEGDHQAPEGFYSVAATQMNPRSREYLSFNVGYPNAYDQSLGRTGDSLMVHGGCRSVGCYAMTNELIEEIYGLAHEAFAGGQREIQLQAYPFRMTPANLQRHMGDANIGFWSELATGSAVFEQTRLPPRVAVCGGRYTFAPSDGAETPRASSGCLSGAT